MSDRPTDIPEDVWCLASMLWGHEVRIGIARAVLVERNRCAKIAERAEIRSLDDKGSKRPVMGRTKIALAIRAGTPA